MTDLMRVWVAPDAYDNPTLWTDGPTPDFPRALLLRVPSNADLFDWIVGSMDALAAEKAAREEAEHEQQAAVDRFWREREKYARISGLYSALAADLKEVADKWESAYPGTYDHASDVRGLIEGTEGR